MDNPFAEDAAEDARAIDRILAPHLPLPLAEPARRDLATYVSELRTWGARLDLVAPRSRDEFWDLALADAAVVAAHEARLGSSGGALLDVGSGGGAPGIPLGILLAALGSPRRLTLVEPRAKRVTFLRSVVARLSSLEAEVLRGRSEKLEDGTFDVAISRATFAPDVWLAEGARLSKRAVWVLLARAEPPETDLELELDVSYVWPLTGAPRRLLRYRRA